MYGWIVAAFFVGMIFGIVVVALVGINSKRRAEDRDGGTYEGQAN